MVRELGEGLKILVLAVFAAVVYGVLHDQVTARICLEYFTVGHPDLGFRNPTVVGLAWGVIATWWVGAILGVFAALCARVGRWPRMDWRELLPWVAVLMSVTGGCAALVGLWTWFGGVGPARGVRELLGGDAELARRFTVDLAIHQTSYAVAGLGGMVLVASIVLRRWRLGHGEAVG